MVLIPLFTLHTSWLLECTLCDIAWPVPEQVWRNLAALAKALEGARPVAFADNGRTILGYGGNF